MPSSRDYRFASRDRQGPGGFVGYYRLYLLDGPKGRFVGFEEIEAASDEEAVRIAYRRLEEGQISSFDLIEQQRKLYDARSRELAARADLNKAIVNIWQATGTVLENTGVTISKKNQRHALPEASKLGGFPASRRGK